MPPRVSRALPPAALAVVAALALAACGPTASSTAGSAPRPGGPATPAAGGPQAAGSPSPAGTESPSASPSSPAGTPSPAPSVLVAGHRVTLPPVGSLDVAEAASRAGVRVPDGRLLSAGSHRVLEAHLTAAEVDVNGLPASVSARLRSGDVVTFGAEPDQVEATTTRTVGVSAPVPAAGLYAGSRAGRAREVVGVRSGEVVKRVVVTEPVIGRLKVPGSVVLTFDDGPDPRWTPRVLALLAAHHVRATFCEIGRSAAAHPALVRAIVAGGHLLCDHTQNHDEGLPRRSPAVVKDEIDGGRRAILAASGGVAPRFFRAPGGNWSPAANAEAAAEGMSPLKWSVDPRDWSRPGVDSIIKTVLGQLRPGGVILMHDGGGDRSQSVAALARLLDLLPGMGYRFVLPTGAVASPGCDGVCGQARR